MSYQLESVGCCYANDVDRHLNSNQKYNCHYKSCNMIGPALPTAHDNIDHQLYKAKSVHQITDNSCSNYRKENKLTSNLAINSEGLEYICNFKSTPHHKVSNQSNGCQLMQTRSGNSFSEVDGYLS